MVNFSHISPSSLKECLRNAVCLALSTDPQVGLNTDSEVSANTLLTVPYKSSLYVLVLRESNGRCLLRKENSKEISANVPVCFIIKIEEE